MNERILELIDKAMEDLPGPYPIPLFLCEKFAELLLDNVLDVVEQAKK